MKKITAWMLVVMLAGAVSGCAKKTASEQLTDDMKKMQGDLNKTAKKMQDDLR